MEYYSLSKFLVQTYGRKIYKIAIDAGFTCPNRDGTVGTRGCIFCSGYGSGDFTPGRELSITEQIDAGKALVAGKMRGSEADMPSYIAYFQAFTNTYATTEVLRDRYMEAVNHPGIVGISIATRPDCISDEVLDVISKINRIKPVWVELGLQTIHERSASYIRRGYELEEYNRAVERLYAAGVHIVSHIIIGLPGESVDDILRTADYVAGLSRGLNDGKEVAIPEYTSIESSYHIDTEILRKHRFGVKLQLLHIIEGTDLATEYKAGKVRELELEEYARIVVEALKKLPESTVIHRITGDGAKRTLIAPKWSADKKRVLNTLNKAIEEA